MGVKSNVSDMGDTVRAEAEEVAASEPAKKNAFVHQAHRHHKRGDPHRQALLEATANSICQQPVQRCCPCPHAPTLFSAFRVDRDRPRGAAPHKVLTVFSQSQSHDVIWCAATYSLVTCHKCGLRHRSAHGCPPFRERMIAHHFITHSLPQMRLAAPQRARLPALSRAHDSSSLHNTFSFFSHLTRGRVAPHHPVDQTLCWIYRPDFIAWLETFIFRLYKAEK
jgi:hypothetical protein